MNKILNKDRTCSSEGCERIVHSSGLCQKHYTTKWRKDYIVRVEGGWEPITESIRTNPVGYAHAHERVRYYRGRAFTYPCVNCGTKARQWALRWDITPNERLQESTHTQVRAKYNDTTYKIVWSSNPMDYDPLCADCHFKLDKKGSLR